MYSISRYIGGKMETKFNMHLCANYTKEKLKSAVCNCVLTDYIIEKLKVAIKRFNQEDIDLFHIYKDFEVAIEKANIISFANIEEWENNKVSVYQDIFNLVVDLDDALAKAELIESGTLIEEFRVDTQEYLVLLNLCDINVDSIDLSMVDVRPEYIDNLRNQLALVDEGQFLSDLSAMKIETISLDTEKERHKYIEQRLSKAQKVVRSVMATLDNELDRLHDDIMNCYDKFHKIAYSSRSDGEKANEAKNVCKVTSPHKN